MNQFELLDQLLESSSVYEGGEDTNREVNESNIGDGYFAVLDSIVESALRESLGNTVLESADDEYSALHAMKVVNESVFNEDTLLEFMHSSITPLLEVSGLNEIEDMSSTAIAALPVYEAYLAAQLVENEEQLEEHLYSIAEDYGMDEEMFDGFVESVEEMLTDESIEHVVCDVNELAEMVNALGSEGPVLESAEVDDKFEYMVSIREGFAYLEEADDKKPGRIRGYWNKASESRVGKAVGKAVSGAKKRASLFGKHLTGSLHKTSKMINPDHAITKSLRKKKIGARGAVAVGTVATVGGITKWRKKRKKKMNESFLFEGKKKMNKSSWVAPPSKDDKFITVDKRPNLLRRIGGRIGDALTGGHKTKNAMQRARMRDKGTDKVSMALRKGSGTAYAKAALRRYGPGAALAATGVTAAEYARRKRNKKRARQEAVAFLECMGLGAPGYDRLIAAM